MSKFKCVKCGNETDVCEPTCASCGAETSCSCALCGVECTEECKTATCNCQEENK